jgi:hypothetical protein
LTAAADVSRCVTTRVRDAVEVQVPGLGVGEAVAHAAEDRDAVAFHFGIDHLSAKRVDIVGWCIGIVGAALRDDVGAHCAWPGAGLRLQDAVVADRGPEVSAVR